MTGLNPEFACPMSKSSLDKMIKKYDVVTPKDRKQRPLSHWIINKIGLEKVSYFNEF
ncbi:MAG: hypothetical protein ACJARO_001235 [Bacteriovoracaceae bacterium]|jgi:hypothetical protein